MRSSAKRRAKRRKASSSTLPVGRSLQRVQRLGYLALFFTFLVSSLCFGQTLDESPDQLWHVGDRRWTVEEEERFAKWVEDTISEDFFIRYKIPTDCADAVYAIRWIYARMASLPTAATTKEGKLIGHWSTEWKHLPTHPEWQKDERFRAALSYLLLKTWTGTLPFDTYPVRISPDSVRPGTLILETGSHTGMIARVYRDGSQSHPLQTWESALPVKVRKLTLRSFFSMKPEAKVRSGLVKFRWPILEEGTWRYLPAAEHPFYSEEQYAPDLYQGSSDFIEAVAKRIDPTQYPPMEKVRRVIETVARLVGERVPMVLAGHGECRRGGCPEGTERWEIHHTAGRDAMITSLMDHLSEIIESSGIHPEVLKQMMEAIRIDISENRSITLYDVYQNHPWFSPHPGESIEARWGLKKCEAIEAQRRATKAAIAYIEKTYRRKNSQYADFTIRTQQRLLRRLREEWTKSGCEKPVMAMERKFRTSSSAVITLRPLVRQKRCDSIHREIRATNDSIAFISRTYRERDPTYRDFAIETQQQLLQRLHDEWVALGCR